jgi:RNA polymerase primary sigma factor
MSTGASGAELPWAEQGAVQPEAAHLTVVHDEPAPLRLRVLDRLVELGADERVAGDFARKLDYREDGEPPANSEIGGGRGSRATNVGARIVIGATLLAGDPLVDEDPFLRHIVSHVETNGNAKFLTRAQVLGGTTVRLVTTAKPQQGLSVIPRPRADDEYQLTTDGVSFDPEQVDEEILDVVADADNEPDATTVAQLVQIVRTPNRRGEKSDLDLVKAYLDQIGKIPLLTAEQEVTLAKRIEAGMFAGEKLRTASASGEVLQRQLERDLRWIVRDGARAKSELIEANLKLVVSYAKRRKNPGMPLLDNIQEGNTGLIHAVELFDYTKGFKFSTYATWWIKQAMSRGAANQSRTIRVPVHVEERMNKLRRVSEDLANDLGRPASRAELAEAMEMSEAQIVDLLSNDREPVSLDLAVGEDGDIELGDLVGDASTLDVAEQASRNLMADLVTTAVDTLSEEQQTVIRMRYLSTSPATYDQIGKVIGKSRAWVIKVEQRALELLRQDDRLLLEDD